MPKPLDYYRSRGVAAALLTRLEETKDADRVVRLAGEFVAQEDEDYRRDAERAFDAGYEAECNRIDAARAAMSSAPHPDAGKPIRRLRCTCCGAPTFGRQFHNQDTGYGLCAACVGYVAVRSDNFEAAHGFKGIHFAIPDQP